MSGSFRNIDYSARPAKSIERKMVSEALRRLNVFGPIAKYRYVSFGLPYFDDFLLFHGDLGIHDMVSIESPYESEERTKYNKPFTCVDVKFGLVGEELSKLSWHKKTILWLDYDSKLNDSILADVALFCTSASSTSIIIVTVKASAESLQDASEAYIKVQEAERPNPQEWLNGYRLEQLIKRVGVDNVPRATRVTGGKRLGGWGSAKTYRHILLNQIEETLHHRNPMRQEASRLSFHQLFNFHYTEGMRMLTFGGILVDEEQKSTISKCDFNSLPFVRPLADREDAYEIKDDAYEIKMPKLTYTEISRLRAHMPTDNCTALAIPIPDQDKENFARLYRWFPPFRRSEM